MNESLWCGDEGCEVEWKKSNKKNKNSGVYLWLFRQNGAHEGPLTFILCTARWNGSEREVLMGFACYYSACYVTAWLGRRSPSTSRSICMNLPVLLSTALCVVMVIFVRTIASSRLLHSGPICERIPARRCNYSNKHHVCSMWEVIWLHCSLWSRGSFDAPAPTAPSFDWPKKINEITSRDLLCGSILQDLQ